MNKHNYKLVQEYVTDIMPLLETPASEQIPFPYLKLNYGGYYPGIYEWDNHHAGMRFSYAGKSEYLKYLTDNLLHYQANDGHTPYSISPESGPAQYRPRLCPTFLAQGSLMYFSQTGNATWARECFPRLKRNLEYIEINYAAPHNLFRPPVSWSSGIDNDVVTTFFQPGTIVPADINSWIFLEFQSMANLAGKLDLKEDASTFRKKAETLRAAVNEVLWYDDVSSYSAYDLCTCSHRFHLGYRELESKIGFYAFQSCSNLIPLYARICSQENAEKMIEKYVISEEHFMSPFGIRSLSKLSEYYNNAIWGNPPRFGGDHERLTNSNWQGPVWTLLSYLMFHALLHYGFKKEAVQLADRTIDVLASSLKKIGCFTENYNAETGQPGYSPKYASWNILASMMHAELDEVPWIMESVFA